MMNNFFKKLIVIYDAKNSKSSSYLYITIAIITMVVARNMGYGSIIVILVTITVSFAFGAILQILRKKKNPRNFKLYLLAMILGIFITTMVSLMQYYIQRDNNIMIANIIKIILISIALLIYVAGSYYIINKKISKRIPWIIAMVYMTLIAILATLFLPPNRM